MNWKALKNFRCPKCDAPLEQNGGLFICGEPRCDFTISRTKFDSIVINLQEKRTTTDNTVERNNKWLNEL